MRFIPFVAEKYVARPIRASLRFGRRRRDWLLFFFGFKKHSYAPKDHIKLIWNFSRNLPHHYAKTKETAPLLAKDTLSHIRRLAKRNKVKIKYIGLGALVFVACGTALATYNILNFTPPYKVAGSASRLIPALSETHGTFIKEQGDVLAYNANYAPRSGENASQTSSPRFSAEFHSDPAMGIDIKDPYTETTVNIKPKFRLADPKSEQNRIVYPFIGSNMVKVVSLGTTGYKEDIILYSHQEDEMEFEYELSLPAGTEARLESNGSIAIYGVATELLGSVSTGSEEDKELLEKTRENGEKKHLLFTFPAPFVKDATGDTTTANAEFALDGNILTLRASGLDKVPYPLSIDPSIYVETARKLMRGNNETNIDFDVDNELIRKGSTTGARFDEFTSSMSLPSARWNHATAVAGGKVYAVGGNDGSSNQTSVYWATFDTNNYEIDSPNPGAGQCSSWCTDSAYNLPAARAGLSLVAYNGYLYAIGGEDTSCTTGNGTGASGVCSTVYVAKLGANGEPALWHPTDTNQATWTYWHRDSDLSSPRSYTAATAYNNRMYLLGGKNSTATGGLSTVEYANLNPTGLLTSWTATGMTALPSARFGHDVHAYNGYLYLVGGNSNGALHNTVNYIKINGDGTLVSSWSNANNFQIPRMSWGGTFSTIWGGYLYVSGGCTAIDAEGECTSSGITNGGTAQVDGSGTAVELVSINADGGLGFWGSISNVSNTRIGYGLTAWRNTIYTIGGCTAQDTATGACTTTSSATQYGIVNRDGDGSTVATSVSSGTVPCSGSNPSNCNLPGTSHIGNMLNATAIMNGYLYIIGGCTSDDCSTTSGNTMYAAIDADGQLRRPSSCAGGTVVDSFCVDSIDPIPGGGLAAAGTAVFGGRIYVVGGQNGSGLKGNIYYSTVNNDGSLEGAWTAQSLSGVGATSVSYTYAHARANPSSAGTHPGNLYIFGGCTSGSGISCTAGSNTDAVYKCNITGDGSVSTCSTSNQLQIGTIPGATGAGLALHAGTVYADYIYLVGGTAPGTSNLRTIRYATFDDNNNVVAVSGSSWIEPTDSSGSSVEMSTGRERGEAFGYNGYLYTMGGYDSGGSGILSDIQFAKINVGDGSLEQFDTSTITISQRWGLSVPVSNSYAYIIGGCTSGNSPSCSVRTDVVQTFQIYNNDSGAPAEYTSAGNLFPTDRFGAAASVMNGYIYVAGGCIGVLDCDNATNTVEYAPLNPDGSIGIWNTTSSLPVDRVYGQLEQAGGTLYYIGGQDDSETAQSTIYYATPDGSGGTGSWTVASSGIGDTASTSAVARTQFGATVWNDQIYVLGGYSDSNSPTNTVFVSPPLSAGGDIAADSWSSTTSFDVARIGATAIAYANNLYVLGGHDGINFLSDVQYTQINADGTLDDWSYTSSLPRNVSHADGFAANGYMYIFGGKQSAITCTTNTYVAPISANTPVATGNSPTGLGKWFLTNERFSAERANLSAVYHEGTAYLMGGSCGTLEGGGGTAVLQDDFDADIDASQWADTSRMTVGTDCGTLSTGNALVSTGNQGGTSAQAQTIDVDVGYGGNVSFYLRIPTSGSANCNPPEAGEDVLLQYSNNGGSGWATIATYDESNFDTPTQITESIPSTAWTDSTRFRWILPDGNNGQDVFAIDDMVITANDTPPLDELMNDDFDPTLEAVHWSSTTGMVEATNCGTLSSGNALVSQGGSTAQAITNNFDLQYGGVVEFVLRIPADSGTACRQPDTNEDLLLQYSLNDGSSWTTFATYDESEYDTPTTISTAIPSSAYASTVRFRWYIPNADTGTDIWAIDDVSVSSFDPILTYTGIHRAVYTPLLAQPQVAKYSIMFDTDSDVFPTYWLLNGIDNSIGARWTLRYRTMNDVDGVAADCGSADMSTWGLDTNFGNVTLGQPEVYTPLDDSGSDIKCARYYYMLVTVDSTQAYGFPDDVTRGPTISDLTLFFTSDPSKRLRHGKTFTGGQQQPLDTPF